MRMTLTEAGCYPASKDTNLHDALVLIFILFNADDQRAIFTVWGEAGNIISLHTTGDHWRFEADTADKHIIAYLASALTDWHTTRRRAGRERRKPTAAELVGQHMQRRAGLSPSDTRLLELNPHELAIMMRLVSHRVNANPEEIFAAL